FFSSSRRHTRFSRDWSSDVCSSDLKKLLPHVYSTPKQQLCLYYPKEKEWNTGMYYVHTLIPWACEWLCHYELWVSTGIWHGGGKIGRASCRERVCNAVAAE